MISYRFLVSLFVACILGSALALPAPQSEPARAARDLKTDASYGFGYSYPWYGGYGYPYGGGYGYGYGYGGYGYPSYYYGGYPSYYSTYYY